MREALRLLVAASAGRCVRTGGGASTREDGRACTRSAGSPIAEAGAAAAAAAAAVRNPHVLGDMGGRVAAASGRRALRVAAKRLQAGRRPLAVWRTAADVDAFGVLLWGLLVGETDP